MRERLHPFHDLFTVKTAITIRSNNDLFRVDYHLCSKKSKSESVNLAKSLGFRNFEIEVSLIYLQIHALVAISFKLSHKTFCRASAKCCILSIIYSLVIVKDNKNRITYLNVREKDENQAEFIKYSW